MKLKGVTHTVLTVVLLATVGAAMGAKSPPVSISFVKFDTGLPTSGQWREGFRIGDMNEDGHPDIVHGPARKQAGTPVIFLGNGKGSWMRWKEARFPALAYDYGDVEIADFNRDGHKDIALAMHLHGFVELTGDGRGGFVNASAGLDYDRNSASNFSSRAIRTTDWNGDGFPDLVAVSEGLGTGSTRPLADRDGVVVYLNQRGKGWSKSDPAVSKGVYSDSIAIGDFDADGHMDVATGSAVMDRKDLVDLWRPNGTSKSSVDLPGGHQFVQAVTAGDLDNDGKDDLAVAYQVIDNDVWYSAIDVFYSRAAGKWERRSLLREPTREGGIAMATGHLVSKKTRDLVALTTQGETLVFLGDGHGGLVRDSKPLPVFGGGCRGAHVELADLDGDGRDEIIAAFADEPAADHCPSGGGITAWKGVTGRQ